MPAGPLPPSLLSPASSRQGPHDGIFPETLLPSMGLPECVDAMCPRGAQKSTMQTSELDSLLIDLHPCRARVCRPQRGHHPDKEEPSVLVLGTKSPSRRGQLPPSDSLNKVISSPLDYMSERWLLVAGASIPTSLFLLIFRVQIRSQHRKAVHPLPTTAPKWQSCGHGATSCRVAHAGHCRL